MDGWIPTGMSRGFSQRGDEITWIGWARWSASVGWAVETSAFSGCAKWLLNGIRDLNVMDGQREVKQTLALSLNACPGTFIQDIQIRLQVVP